jgi:hypothetical protein
MGVRVQVHLGPDDVFSGLIRQPETKIGVDLRLGRDFGVLDDCAHVAEHLHHLRNVFLAELAAIDIRRVCPDAGGDGSPFGFERARCELMSDSPLRWDGAQ